MPLPDNFPPARGGPNASAAETTHRVLPASSPFVVPGDVSVYFERLRTLLAGTPRTVVVTATDEYLHAVCRTRIGFPDDIEIRLLPEERVIHVRSASRLAPFWDLGVNRRRIERLRQQLEGR